MGNGDRDRDGLLQDSLADFRQGAEGTLMGGNWKRPERPTGIVRTLPSLYGDASVGARKYQASIAALERGKIPCIYIALQSVPKFDVGHIYLLVDGRIDVRLNIAGYEPGSTQKCWDETIRTPKFWCVCTGPVVRPPEPIERKGFQGFRYTSAEELF